MKLRETSIKSVKNIVTLDSLTDDDIKRAKDFDIKVYTYSEIIVLGMGDL